MVSVVHLAYFIIFWGFSRCLLQISIDEVKAGQSCLERLEPGGGFLAEIWIHYLIFPCNA